MRTQKDLAMTLGIQQSSVSSAKKRNIFPERWGLKLAEKYGLSLDTLFRGDPDHEPEKNCFPKGGIESVYERLIVEKDKLLEAKDREIALLKKCHSKNSNDDFRIEPGNNGGDPLVVPSHPGR